MCVLNTPSQYFYWDDIAGKQALEEDQGLCASRARRSMIKRTPSEIPPPVARSFMSDMKAYHAEDNPLRRDRARPVPRRLRDGP